MTTLLLVGSSPRNRSNAQVDAERRAIENAVRTNGSDAVLRITHCYDFRREDLARMLQTTAPRIVHFCGHGDELGRLLAVDADGRAVEMDQDALAELIAQFKDSVRCVFLNACYSAELATKLSDDIDVAIGAPGALDTRSAILAAEAFYQAVAFGQDFQRAFERAKLVSKLIGGSSSGLKDYWRAGVTAPGYYLRDEAVDSVFDPDELVDHVFNLFTSVFLPSGLRVAMQRLRITSQLPDGPVTPDTFAVAAATLVVIQRRLDQAWFTGLAKKIPGRRREIMSVAARWKRYFGAD